MSPHRIISQLCSSTELIILVLQQIYCVVQSHHSLMFPTKEDYAKGKKSGHENRQEDHFHKLLQCLSDKDEVGKFLFLFSPYCFSHICMQFQSKTFQNSNFPQESNVALALCSFSMHLWIIQSVFIVHHVVPCLNCLRDCVTRPGCCIDADGLFMGDATLRKIFCLQETLRGVGGRPPLTESLLQPDRVLFLPSPLLREKTAASQTPDK